MAEPFEMRARLARLRSELADERAILAELGQEVEARIDELSGRPADAPEVALAALKVHRYYTALESILLRIERTLAAVPVAGDWHVDLLRGATRELPGIRPAILPRAVFDPLHEALRFRHFFRHAYAVAVDGEKLARVARKIAGVRGEVDEALVAFDSVLGRLADGLARDE